MSARVSNASRSFAQTRRGEMGGPELPHSFAARLPAHRRGSMANRPGCVLESVLLASFLASLQKNGHPCRCVTTVPTQSAACESAFATSGHSLLCRIAEIMPSAATRPLSIPLMCRTRSFYGLADPVRLSCAPGSRRYCRIPLHIPRGASPGEGALRFSIGGLHGRLLLQSCPKA